MSFFLYNQNGQQAIARPHLDGQQTTQDLGAPQIDNHIDMPKYHAQDSWESRPMHRVRILFMISICIASMWPDEWREVLSHDADGAVQSGSVHDLADAFSQGCEVKVGVQGLCGDLAAEPATAVDHEVFVQTGSCYYYTAPGSSLLPEHINHSRQACPTFGIHESGLGLRLVDGADGRIGRIQTL